MARTRDQPGPPPKVKSSTSKAASKRPKSTTAQCALCHAVLARAGDLGRHMRLHYNAKDKAAAMHHCPWPGCEYRDLQKSNVNTHLRTHTNEKKPCPEPNCDFSSGDPGSLTRHRKRKHNYVPAQRAPRHSGGKRTKTKDASLHVPAPYPQPPPPPPPAFTPAFIPVDEDDYDYDERDPAPHEERRPAPYDERHSAPYDERRPVPCEERRSAPYDERHPSCYGERRPASHDEHRPVSYEARRPGPSQPQERRSTQFDDRRPSPYTRPAPYVERHQSHYRERHYSSVDDSYPISPREPRLISHGMCPPPATLYPPPCPPAYAHYRQHIPRRSPRPDDESDRDSMDTESLSSGEDELVSDNEEGTSTQATSVAPSATSMSPPMTPSYASSHPRYGGARLVGHAPYGISRSRSLGHDDARSVDGGSRDVAAYFQRAPPLSTFINRARQSQAEEWLRTRSFDKSETRDILGWRPEYGDMDEFLGRFGGGKKTQYMENMMSPKTPVMNVVDTEDDGENYSPASTPPLSPSSTLSSSSSGPSSPITVGSTTPAAFMSARLSPAPILEDPIVEDLSTTPSMLFESTSFHSSPSEDTDAELSDIESTLGTNLKTHF